MKLVVTENVTIDGVFELTEGWFSPASGEDSDNSDLVEAMSKQSANEDAVLLGRKTFEDFRGYWPLQTDDTTGVTAHLNRVQKYVISSSMTDPEWENATVLSGSLVEEVERLKEQPGKDLLVTGSMSVVYALITAGLVDEYRLFIFPVVIGKGKRLFEDATGVPQLELIESQHFNSGVVLSTYRPK